MATCRASSEGDKKRPKRNSMREETIEELKANYEKIAMDKRTPVPTVQGPTGTAMSVKSLGNNHHPTHMNNSTAVGNLGLWQKFSATTPEGEPCEVLQFRPSPKINESGTGSQS